MKYDKFDRDTLRFLFNDEVLESLDRRLCGLIVPSDDNSSIEKIKGEDFFIVPKPVGESCLENI